jgi:branched-chain amino acid transport system ATP-binding protein
MSSLSTQHLTKCFGGVSAIDNLSISIPDGLVTGIVGPNGSGKTTLINTITGMLPYDSGMVRVGTVALSHIHPADVPTYGITRTFQQVRLFGQMSVLDNILVVLTEKSIGKALFERHTAYHRAQAKELLAHVGLWEKRNEHAEHLSYGQRKLLEIARALAMRTSIILFDEPYAGLFPEMRERVSNTIAHLREQQKTIVLIEHDMHIIQALCDHLIVLDAGRLLAEGAPKDVLQRADVREAYLGK